MQLLFSFSFTSFSTILISLLLYLLPITILIPLAFILFNMSTTLEIVVDCWLPIPAYMKLKSDTLQLNIVQTNGSLSSGTQMMTIPVQMLSRTEHCWMDPEYCPTSLWLYQIWCHLQMSWCPGSCSCNLQVVSSFQNTSEILKCQAFVVVLNEWV